MATERKTEAEGGCAETVWAQSFPSMTCTSVCVCQTVNSKERLRDRTRQKALWA